MPEEFAQLGQHVLAATTFTSNFQLVSEVGYFDVAAYRKPLLHLWSLAIEEQFYLVWPLLLAAVWHRRPVVWAGALLLVSLALCVAADDRVGFYMPHLRAWELMAGAVLIWAPRLTNWAGTVGLSLIVGACWLTAPGWQAFAVLGAALVLNAGGTGAGARLLSWPTAVWVGRISYPLYLWHWPLLSILSLMLGELPSHVAAGALAASGILAWWTHMLVERPVRLASLTKLAPSLVALLAVIGAAGLHVDGAMGYPGRFEFTSTARQLKTPDLTQPCKGEPGQDLISQCLRSRPAPPVAAVVGDSHAGRLFRGIAPEDPASWLLLSAGGKPPLLDTKLSYRGRDFSVDQVARFSIDYVVAQPLIETVVLVFDGNGYLQSAAYSEQDKRSGYTPDDLVLSPMSGPSGLGKMEAFERGLIASVDALQRAGRQVVVMLDVPQLPFMPKRCARPWRTNSCTLPRAEVVGQQAAMRRVIAAVVEKRPSVRVFDPTNLFCDGSTCRFLQNRLLYDDTNHLSPAGSELVGQALLAWLRQDVRPASPPH